MKALVVGGTGFLGLNIVEALEAHGHEVAATRRPSSNTILIRRMKVPLLAATLEDRTSLEAAMAGREVVFVTAGHYPRYSVDTDAQVAAAVSGLRNVLEAARLSGVRRLIYTGSVATVAAPAEDRPATEEDGRAAVPPGATYHAVKVALEEEVERAVDAGLDAVSLLPTGCIGPYDHKVGTGFFVVGMANGALPFFVDGKINIIDSADVAEAHIAAVERGRRGERYILGGHDTTVRAMLEAMSRRFDVPMPERELSPDEAYTLAAEEEARCIADGRGRPALSREMVDAAVHGLHVSSAKAQRELGLSVRPLGETLDRSFAWYRRSGYIRRPRPEGP